MVELVIPNVLSEKDLISIRKQAKSDTESLFFLMKDEVENESETPDDIIGEVIRVQPDGENLRILVELDNPHRFIDRSSFYFDNSSGYWHLFQKEPAAIQPVS